MFFLLLILKWRLNKNLVFPPRAVYVPVWRLKLTSCLALTTNKSTLFPLKNLDLCWVNKSRLELLRLRLLLHDEEKRKLLSSRKQFSAFPPFFPGLPLFGKTISNDIPRVLSFFLFISFLDLSVKTPMDKEKRTNLSLSPSQIQRLAAKLIYQVNGLRIFPLWQLFSYSFLSFHFLLPFLTFRCL